MQARVRVDVELIDRSTRYSLLQAHAVCTHCSHANKTGWCTHARHSVCVRARRISYRPAPAPASRNRPVAPLPELRRIVTRLDMPAPRRIDSAPSPRTPRQTVRTLNYHGTALVKLLCISPGLIDIFY